MSFGAGATVKRYLAAGSWRPFKSPERKERLDGLADWLKGRFHGIAATPT